jgi:hypothetical protein
MDAYCDHPNTELKRGRQMVMEKLISMGRARGEDATEELNEDRRSSGGLSDERGNDKIPKPERNGHQVRPSIGLADEIAANSGNSAVGKYFPEYG